MAHTIHLFHLSSQLVHGSPFCSAQRLQIMKKTKMKGLVVSRIGQFVLRREAFLTPPLFPFPNGLLIRLSVDFPLLLQLISLPSLCWGMREVYIFLINMFFVLNTAKLLSIYLVIYSSKCLYESCYWSHYINKVSTGAPGSLCFQILN